MYSEFQHLLYACVHEEAQAILKAGLPALEKESKLRSIYSLYERMTNQLAVKKK